MNPFSEDNLVEQTAVKIFGGIWGSVHTPSTGSGDNDAVSSGSNVASNFINAYTEENDAQLGREHQGEVVLTKFLRPALEKLNSDASKEAIDRAMEALTHDRSAMSMVRANEAVWKLVRDGVKVEMPNGKGEQETITVRVFDFADPDNNHFLLVSQMWITGDLHKRRPDLIGFVNGIPLVLVELKASHKNLRNAYEQNIRDYKDTIPHLFWYNAFVIISNGIESKVGTISGEYEHFNEWKKVEKEEEIGRVDLATVIRGTCTPARLLDLIENFTLFDASRAETVKIVARYFQLLGVNRAFEKVKRRDDHRLGVFWHTQGSGKSYSMVFLSQKVMRKLAGNFTFVIVTDRCELDGQIHGTFSSCGAVYEQKVHAESIAHLRDLLREDHRHIFTLIHKFGTRGDEVPPILSYRRDVIVIADEAHRTQYDRLAQNMRIALPHASFLGFTGTPLLAEEEKTRETFGDYISTYNFAQSVADGATVPLYYENRVPKLENVNPNIQKDLERVMEFYDLSDEEEARVEREFSTFYHLITREDRLNTLAEDIVSHFVERGYNGKAMVVSIDTRTAVRMYTKVQAQMKRHLAKLRIARTKATDEREQARLDAVIERHEGIDMAVVVSQRQNEIADMEQFDIDMRPIRARILNEDLEMVFKKADSNLRIVFVCAMWMTGFDVPNLSTLYLDKPLKNHTLMQTIARANRVYPEKRHGLIVDYIGVFRNLQNALALYALPAGGSADDIIQDKAALVTAVEQAVGHACAFLKDQGHDLDALLAAPSEEKLAIIESCANTLLRDEETKHAYLSLAREAYNAYRDVLPDTRAEDFYHAVTALKVIASRIKAVTDEQVDVSQVKRDLEALLDESIKTGAYVITAKPKVKDLSAVNLERLKKLFATTEHKHIAAAELATTLEQKLRQMVEQNRTRQRFWERLHALLAEYNAGSKNVEEFFDQLVDLAAALGEEEGRAIAASLSEEELAIFDLIRKESLTPDEEMAVKKVAQELLAKLKTEKLVLDWKRRNALRADVQVTIRDVLYDGLPKAYNEHECDVCTEKVFAHVYDCYADARTSVFA